jgi:CelD/BcsL family acetyltransferase involved in cellulose biosynthesis
VKITTFSDKDVFNALKSEWNILVGNSISNRIFSTWEWQSTWWNIYEPGELWVITCRDERGLLIGIAPWFIQNDEHGKRIRSIGCVDVTDYVDLIVDRERTRDVFEAIARYLHEQEAKYDAVDLCNIPEYSPTHTDFHEFLKRVGFEVELKQQEVCPQIHLPVRWEDYLSSLDKKNRHELRRKIRRLEGANEQISWYLVDQSSNLEVELERFLHLMASSQYEKASFLENPQNAQFFSSIVTIAHHNNWLQLSFLRINGRAVASYLNFVYGDSVQVYNSGLLPDEFGHLSPGIVLLAYNIRHAVEAGYKIFDFLRGNEDYKYRLGGKDTRLFTLKATVMKTHLALT